MTLLAAHPSHMGPPHCYLRPDFLFIEWLGISSETGFLHLPRCPLDVRCRLLRGGSHFRPWLQLPGAFIINEMDDGNVKFNILQARNANEKRGSEWLDPEADANRYLGE